MKHGYTVHRDGKTYRVHPKKSRSRVESSCVEGAPAKHIPGRLSSVKLHKGDLIRYGYSYRLPDSRRHDALKKAVNVYGALSVYRKLDIVAKLSRSHPAVSKVFAEDRDWVRRHYPLRGHDAS